MKTLFICSLLAATVPVIASAQETPRPNVDVPRPNTDVPRPNVDVPRAGTDTMRMGTERGGAPTGSILPSRPRGN